LEPPLLPPPYPLLLCRPHTRATAPSFSQQWEAVPEAVAAA
jgi:hypothetical protein